MTRTAASRTAARRARRTRLTAAAAAATVAAGTALTGPLAQGASAVPGVAAPLFDPASVGWYSHRDQTSAQFASTFAAHSDAGYLPVDLEIDTESGYRVGSVWQKNPDGREWREKRDLTSAGFSDYWNDAKADGLRLIEQETYVVDGARRYAGIWIENTEDLTWSSHRGQTAAQLADTVAAARAANRMPVDFDEYVVDGTKRYNTVWVANTARADWKLENDLTATGWAAAFDSHPGYRVLTFESLQTSKGQRYGGVFVKDSTGRKSLFRRDMDAKSYTNWWHRYADMGYRMVALDAYATSSGMRYAASWRQNSTRPTWALRGAVDALAQKELDDNTTPGLSVAVYVNGVAKYLRGFGSADVGAGEWMDADHVGSIASVSKAVAGVLTMRMVEQDLLDLDDKTRTWVPSMPSKHGHTVGDLLANRGCVHHYDGGESAYEDKSYATALDAAKKFWNDALVKDCDFGEYNYSTHGYTLLGAALESAGGDDIKDLLRKKLTNPYKLGTLGPQNFSSSVHRMSIYGKTGADEIDTFNNDWKVLGGGIDSSVADLGSFGAKLIGGQILDAGSLSTMFTAPNSASNYAYGWSTGKEDGTQVVAKNGAFAGNLAYLRMFPEKGIVVAVMCNSKTGGASATGLGTAIGSIVLDSVA